MFTIRHYLFTFRQHKDNLNTLEVISMDMKRHLKSALKQLGFDKPRKAQIIPMNTLDAEQDAIVIAATGSGKQVAELACHAVVVLPRGIQAVHFAAPCVEAPVDAAAFAFAVDDKGREAGHARCRTAPPSTERSCVRFKWFRSRAERLCVRHRRLTVTNRHVQTRSSGSLHAAQIPRAYKTRPARV